MEPREIEILRELAGRVAELAALPEQQERKTRWLAHNGLRGDRPMVLCYPEGAWVECLPPDTLECRDPILYGWEKRLRMQLFNHERIGDDHVVAPWFNVGWDADLGNLGLDVHQRTVDADAWSSSNAYYLHPNLDIQLQSTAAVGAYNWYPPLVEPEDVEKLTAPVVTVNREETARRLAMAEEIFGDVLPSRIHGWMWTSACLAATAVQLRGMETLMFDTIDRPDWVHRFLALLGRFADDRLDQLEALGLLCTNHEDEWVGTGGVGFTDELPGPDFDGERVRCRDMWGLDQAQDLVGFSPDMLEEFFLPYSLPILERFGLNCYGCCEPVHDRMHVIEKVPRLRRVSVSPFCDVPKAAELLGDRYIASYKPNPSLLSTAAFREESLRDVLRRDLEALHANGCHVEILMKDLHSVQGDTSRLGRFVDIAREVVDEVWGG